MTTNRPQAAAAAATLALAVLLYLYDPATTAIFPPCPFRQLTGLLCPLCGSLRAAHALLHGHAFDAFRFNPLMFTGACILAIRFAIRTAMAPELKLGPTTDVVITPDVVPRVVITPVGPSFSSGVIARRLAVATALFTVARNVL
jgi:hypothetical protein